MKRGRPKKDFTKYDSYYLFNQNKKNDPLLIDKICDILVKKYRLINHLRKEIVLLSSFPKECEPLKKELYECTAVVNVLSEILVT